MLGVEFSDHGHHGGVVVKVALVSPAFPFSGRVPMVPPILEYLGALTLREAPGAILDLRDANQLPVDPAALDADLVGVSVWTATAPWAYRFADACRAAGKRVVLGGIHVTACPDDALRHADAIVTGEAESVWGEVLRDAAAGRLRPRYDGVQQPLAGLPMPLDARLPGRYRFRAFFTMRGCPYACRFCSVHAFFGRTIRYRPVDEVAAEIEARAGSVWFDGDDNIWGADPARALALFERLAAGTPRRWYGFGDLKSVEGETGRKLVAAARRSGLFSVWVGWESDSPEALAAMRAGGKQGRDRLEAVKRLQGEGIEVVLFSVLGGRHDGLDAYRRTLELADRLRVGVHPVLLTPLPGTDVWREYEPHLLPGLGWEAFTGTRAVFTHPDPALTPLRREAEYHALCRELFRPSRVVRNLGGIGARGFPATHLLAGMKTIPMARALGRARAEWLAAHRDAPEAAVLAERAPSGRALAAVGAGALAVLVAALVLGTAIERGDAAGLADAEVPVAAAGWAALAALAWAERAARRVGSALARVPPLVTRGALALAAAWAVALHLVW